MISLLFCSILVDTYVEMFCYLDERQRQTDFAPNVATKAEAPADKSRDSTLEMMYTLKRSRYPPTRVLETDDCS